MCLLVENSEVCSFARRTIDSSRTLKKKPSTIRLLVLVLAGGRVSKYSKQPFWIFAQDTWPPVFWTAFSCHSAACKIYASPDCFYVAKSRLKPRSGLPIFVVCYSRTSFDSIRYTALFSSFSFSHSSSNNSLSTLLHAFLFVVQA
jgi:hypothetical protein